MAPVQRANGVRSKRKKAANRAVELTAPDGMPVIDDAAEDENLYDGYFDLADDPIVGARTPENPSPPPPHQDQDQDQEWRAGMANTTRAMEALLSAAIEAGRDAMANAAGQAIERAFADAADAALRR